MATNPTPVDSSPHAAAAYDAEHSRACALGSQHADTEHTEHHESVAR